MADGADVDRDDIPQLMLDLVDADRLAREHAHQFGAGAKLASAVFNLLAGPEPEEPDAATDPFPDIERDPVDFETRRALDADMTALTIQTTLQAVRADDPGGFAEFLAAAAQHPCSEEFQETVTRFVNEHYAAFATTIRNDPDALVWNAAIQLDDLGRAAIDVGGGAEFTGYRLRALAAHIQQETAPAYLLALDAGLYDDPESPEFPLSRKHRDATGDRVIRYWDRAFTAIDACPDTPAGRELQSDLLARADAHLTSALADFAGREVADQFLQEHPTLAAGLRSAYTMIRARLDAELGRSGPGFRPDAGPDLP